MPPRRASASSPSSSSAATSAAAFIARTITSPKFEVPTTIARSGGRNYVVNAKFNQAPTPATPYEVVKVPKR